MDLSRRLIGVSAVSSQDGKITDVDINGLVRRLLLFDKYVLVTIRLQEFPFFARYLGYEGLRDLLAANLIEIRCECLQLSQIAQSGMFGDPILPAFSYKFNWIDASDKKKYIHDSLQHMHGVPRLQRKQVAKLKRTIAEAIRPLPAGIRAELWPPFENELLHNASLIRKAVEMVVQARLGLADVPFSLAVHRESQDIFKVKTDLHHRLNIGELEGHKLVEAGLMGIAGLSQNIMEMKAYSAISGFRDEELPLFRHKLDFLADSLSSQTKERNFRRVIELAGLPEFPSSDGMVNVDKLLKARDSSEAREFRDWLGGVSNATDDEIRDRVASLRARAGLIVGSETGKAMRFLITAGVGLVPGAELPALGLSVADQFIVDRLLPRSGIAAFVNNLYISIFKPIKMN
jgi:hypothetical protein